MRVLILTQHFAPEITAGAFRVEAFAAALARRGHEVEVICPVPNHPSGRIESGYRGRLVRRSGGSVPAMHLWVFTRPQKTRWTRLAYYGSFFVGATLAGSVLRRPDIILASSPPLSVGAAGMAVAARYRCPLVFDVRDLWPDSAVALGELGEGRLLRLAERLEATLYRRAELILTANEAFTRHVVDLAPAGSQVVTVPNGTTEEWMTIGEAEPDRSEAGLPQDRFVWVYAGNLGLAQSLDVAIEAAAMLGDGFQLVIVGAGPRRESLRELAESVAPGLVEFRELLEPAQAARLLRAADALLVAERQDRTVSAKLYDYCALDRPIVTVAQGELERIVRSEEIALHVSLGDPDALAQELRRLRDEPELGERLGSRARAYAARHLRRDQAEDVAIRLERLV